MQKNHHPGIGAKVWPWDFTPADPRKPGKCDGEKTLSTLHPHSRKGTVREICLDISCERLQEVERRAFLAKGEFE